MTDEPPIDLPEPPTDRAKALWIERIFSHTYWTVQETLVWIMTRDRRAMAEALEHGNCDLRVLRTAADVEAVTRAARNGLGTAETEPVAALELALLQGMLGPQPEPWSFSDSRSKPGAYLAAMLFEYVMQDRDAPYSRDLVLTAFPAPTPTVASEDDRPRLPEPKSATKWAVENEEEARRRLSSKGMAAGDTVLAEELQRMWSAERWTPRQTSTFRLALAKS